ncbi:MAG: hypothetical protein GWP91_11500 [Rhodobacterales bacterium]|nr:hypothetical protein [Rhodobacterales bacterium]
MSDVGILTATHDGVRVELRRDLRWHDGERVSGVDVCATVDALHSDEHPNPVGARVGRWIRHCSVDPTDVMIAQLVLTDVSQPVSLQFPLLPAHLDGDLADPNHSLRKTPVGTGPWLAKTTVSPRRLVPHRGHPGVRPTLVISTAPTDPVLALAALTSGGIGGMPAVPAEWIPALREHPGLNLTAAPLNTAIYAALNPSLDANTRRSLKMAIHRDALCDDLVGTWPDAVQPPCQDITGPFRRDDDRYNQSVRAIEHTPVTSAGSLRVAIQSELEIDAVALGHWLVDAWAPMKLTVEIVPLQTLWTTSPAHRTGQWDVVIANLTPNDLTAHFGLDRPANWFNQTPPLDGLRHSPDPSTGRALHAAMEADPRWLFLVQIDAMAAWSPAHAPVWMTPWQGLNRAQDWGWFTGEVPGHRPHR